MSIEVSVIMPVYNGGETLNQAIKSVLNQSFKDIELILIDDGSTDESLVVCNAYKEKDSRVTVIHQENMGICGTRNKGIEMACGKYIAFIDDDDVYDEKLIEMNYLLLEKYDGDMIKYGSDCAVTINGKRTSNNSDMKTLHILNNDEEKKEAFIQLFKSHLLVYVWDMIVKKELIREKNICFDTYFKHGHEDILFAMECVYNAKTIIVNPYTYYCHIVGEKTTSGGFFRDQIDATNYLIKKEHKIFTMMNIKNEYWQEVLAVRLLYLCQYMSHHKSDMKFIDIYKEIRNFSLNNQCKFIIYFRFKGLKELMKSVMLFLYNHNKIGTMVVCIKAKKLIINRW